jgi:hypothetical protein
MNDEDKALALKCGLEGSLKLFGSNPAAFEALKPLLEGTGVAATGCDSKTGSMFLHAAANLTGDKASRRMFLARYIAAGRYATQPQVVAAVNYLKSKSADVTLDEGEFEAATGVDVRVTDAEIEAQVRTISPVMQKGPPNDAALVQTAAVISSVRSQLVEQRYLFPIMDLLRDIKAGKFAWADGSA